MEELPSKNLNYDVNMSDIHIIINLIKIFDAFIDDLESINPYYTTNKKKKQTQVEPNPNAEMNKDGEEKPEENEEHTDVATMENTKYWELAERMFVFALMWALGGPLDQQDRVKLMV